MDKINFCDYRTRCYSNGKYDYQSSLFNARYNVSNIYIIIFFFLNEPSATRHLVVFHCVGGYCWFLETRVL